MIHRQCSLVTPIPGLPIINSQLSLEFLPNSQVTSHYPDSTLFPLRQSQPQLFEMLFPTLNTLSRLCLLLLLALTTETTSNPLTHRTRTLLPRGNTELNQIVGIPPSNHSIPICETNIADPKMCTLTYISSTTWSGYVCLPPSFPISPLSLTNTHRQQ